jgi:pyruvate/2-oxoglutarate dehydrogenase complex dihydrolipoamide acyltransferase (E2) component
MLVEIIMPRLGDASSAAWVAEWKKSVGDPVEMGEVICVVAIDKAEFDFESPYDGMLAEILVQGNAIVAPGIPIGRIDVAKEA